MNTLEISGLSLRLSGKPILNGLSARFSSGLIHAVVGPNGAGKSTFASTVMGLSGYGHFEGEIRFRGTSLRGLSVDQRGRMGITLGWQDPARFEGLTVRDFLSAASRGASEDKMAEVLGHFRFEPDVWLDRAVDRTLSGGERKKIELASILMMDASLVLLDEPDSGIDVEALQKIFEAIHILKNRGATVILITHSAAVLRQADEACLMCHGTILEHGPMERIIPYFEDKCVPCGHKNFPLDEAGVRRE
jgi:Fe-S cluster assembly ATP-binding protein